jgi:hypothetical protein
MSANVGGLIISATLPDINSLRINGLRHLRLQIISLVLEENKNTSKNFSARFTAGNLLQPKHLFSLRYSYV